MDTKKLIFAGLIPKGRYANISLLGRKLPPDAVSAVVVPIVRSSPCEVLRHFSS